MAKKAIIRAKLDGVLTELMFKTGVDNVVWETVDGSEVMLSTKLAEIIADLAKKDTIADREAAITALKQEMLGDAPVEAYNTFTELAAYIAEHQDAADALTAAIGNKADKSTVEAIQETLNGLGALATKSTVSESDLDSALAEKVNAAAEGNHAHANKTVLDGITEDKVNAWDAAEGNAKAYTDEKNAAMNTRMEDVEGKAHEHGNKALLDTYTQTEANLADAVAKKHEHSNKSTLDTITDAKINAWDNAEQNAKDYADGLAGNYDAKGAAATAEANAKAYADGLAGNYDTKGSAATAEANAKAYADGLGTVTIGGTAYDLEIEIVE